VVGQLGRGATAYVYKVKSRNGGDELYALKVIDKEEIVKKNLEKRVKNEIEIHILLNGFQS
jgi:serine/threonine protein kinase